MSTQAPGGLWAYGVGIPFVPVLWGLKRSVPYPEKFGSGHKMSRVFQVVKMCVFLTITVT